jgi:hypothetical protein
MPCRDIGEYGVSGTDAPFAGSSQSGLDTLHLPGVVLQALLSRLVHDAVV